MYDFKMTRERQELLLNNCNFNNLEKFIFNNLVEEKQRKQIYLLAKAQYNISESTVKRKIKRIIQKIKLYEEGQEISYKVYIHVFPNGKKYVGVCQCCKDRWNNGLGYANNVDMFQDIQKYGWNNIEHRILIETTDSVLAYKLEKIFIRELNLVNDGYNNI